MSETQTEFGPVRHSATLGQLAAALAKFQGGMRGVARGNTVKTRSYSYSYADLAAVIDASREGLARNEIAVVQVPSAFGPLATITTMLLHSSGEWVSGELTLTAADPSAQIVGSALSYARRYALLAMLGIATEDDDGQVASQPPRQTSGQQTGNGAAGATAIPITAPQQEDINQLTIDLGITEAQLAAGLKRDFPQTSGDWHQLTSAQASQLIDRLRRKKAGQPGGATPAAAGSPSAQQPANAAPGKQP